MHDKPTLDLIEQAQAHSEHHAMPLVGWALPLLLRLDRHRPGMLYDMHRAMSRRRQVVYACLAMGAMESPEPYARLLGEDHCGWHGADWLGLLGEALVTVDTRKLLRLAYGDLPDGFAPHLERLGPDPAPQAVYARLHAISSDPSKRRLHALLAELPRITAAKLATVEALPEPCLHPGILHIVMGLDDARAVAAAVEIALSQSDATVCSIRKSVTDLRPESTLARWVHGLLSGFTRSRNQPDVSGLPGAVLLDSGARLREAGRQHGNCLGRPDHLLEVACGYTAFVTFPVDLTTVIATLRRVASGWCVTGLLSPHNTVPHESVREDALARLEVAGFHPLGGPTEPAYEALRGLCSSFWPEEDRP